MSERPINTVTLEQSADMEAWGESLAACLRAGLMVFLSGELGAGKTTLVRGVLRGLGYSGSVKSPTFTLVEPYEGIGSFNVYHFDLYRMRNAEELEDMGWRDYVNESSVCLVEWPEKGQGVLPVPDITITIRQTDHARQLTPRASTLAGRTVLECL